MMEKCKSTKKNGEPCSAWAMPNGYCRRHGGETVADQETSASEIEEPEVEESVAIENQADPEAAEKPIVEKCGIITSKGTPCKLWVVENGRCRRHQGVSDTVEETVAEPEEETAEPPKEEAAVEATEPQEKKPAQKRRKRKKRKRKPKKCGALTTKGTLCTFKVITNGRRCGKHQGAPDAPLEAFLNKEKAVVPQTSPEKEGKTGSLKYGTYISSLIDEGEVEVFNEFFSLFYKDFILNSSSDRMNCEIACIYYAKLLQAIKNDDTETASKFDQLLKNKLQDLKASNKK